MDVFASESFVGIFASSLDRFFGGAGGDQAIAAFADEVAASGFAKCIADFEVVFRFEELHQRPLRFAIAKGFGDEDFFEVERIEPGVVHAGGHIERSGDEVLDLIRFVPVSFQKNSQFDHRFDRAAWMGSDEVRDDVLLLASLVGGIFELLGEVLKVIVGGFPHFEEHIGIDVFGGDLEVSSDVMLSEFTDVLGGLTREVHTDAAGYEDFFDTGGFASFSHQFDHRLMIDTEEFADFRVDAGLASADGFDIGFGASHLVHVGGGTTDIADDALEVFVVRHLTDFLEDGFFGSRLDDATLMGRDGAEGAASEATTHDGDGVFDHVKSRDGLGVTRVWLSCVGEPVDTVHGLLTDGEARDIADDGLRAMALDQASGVEGIGFVVDHARRDGEGDFVGADLLVGWKLEGIFWDGFGGTQCEGDTSHIAKVFDRFARFESPSHFDDRVFPHPETD